MKVAVLAWLFVIAAAVYAGIEFGGVYYRKYKLVEAVKQELSFAGQRPDDGIRQRVLEHVEGMDLPREARLFGFTRIGRPRSLRVSIAYPDTVNLLLIQKQIRVSVEVRRRF